MRSEEKESLMTCGVFLVGYVIFTLLAKFVDVRAIGPAGTTVGLAGLNGALNQAVGGFHARLYTLSKLLGYLILLLAVCVVLLAVLQLIRRRRLRAVNWDLKLFALYGVLVFVVYEITAHVSINYRPVILDAEAGLEKSYPSSHTLLAVSVIGAIVVQLQLRVRDQSMQKILIAAAWILAGAAVLVRFLSGVHWLTDIVGGILLGFALTELYRAAVKHRYHRFH